MATDLVRFTGDKLDHEMQTLRDNMERLWANPFGVLRWPAFSGNAGLFEAELPAVDVAETPTEVSIKVALPGWKPENVAISYTGGMVVITGNAEDTIDEKDKRYHRKEIRSKAFTRSFDLPTDVDVKKAAAEFKSGLLTISLPKSEVVKPQQIKIVAK